MDVLCMVAAVLGLMSLALPWINESDSSDGDLRSLWYYVEGHGIDSDVNVFAITAGLILIGSLLALVSRLGGLALLAGIISFVTISIPSTDSRTIGFYFAVVASAAGVLSLALRSPIHIPRRFLTVRSSEVGLYEVNLLAVIGGVVGLMCFFLPWFRIEWLYPYTEMQFASSFNLYQFSSGYVSSLLSATAGVCFLAGSLVALFSPTGSLGQLAGVSLFYIDLRTNAAEFRYYFGWWTNPTTESFFAIGFYLGIICVGLVVASVFVRWRVRISGRALRWTSAWSLGAPAPALLLPSRQTPSSDDVSFRQLARSSLKPLFIIFVILVLVVSSAALAYAMPWSRLEVGVWNNDPDQRTHIAIYVDGEGKVVDYIEPGTSYEKSFLVRAGYHRVGLDYGFVGGIEGSEIDGALDWSASVKVKPLRTSTMSVGLGFSYSERPVIELTSEPYGNGEKVTIVSVNEDSGSWVYWDGIDITLLDGSSAVKWDPWDVDLDGGIFVEKTYQQNQLGALTVNCTIADIAGNARLDAGDFFLLTTGDDYRFNATVTYTVYLIHEYSTLASEITFQGRY